MDSLELFDIFCLKSRASHNMLKLDVGVRWKGVVCDFLVTRCEGQQKEFPFACSVAAFCLLVSALDLEFHGMSTVHLFSQTLIAEKRICHGKKAVDKGVRILMGLLGFLWITMKYQDSKARGMLIDDPELYWSRGTLRIKFTFGAWNFLAWFFLNCFSPLYVTKIRSLFYPWKRKSSLSHKIIM